MKEAIVKAPSGRPTRKPVGYRDRLRTQNTDPNYVYRWVNANLDQGDRVNILKEAGYETAPAGVHRVTNGRVDDSKEPGSVEVIPGGQGDKLVLMRQKREYYEEDQAEKQKRVQSLEAHQRKTPDGFYGKISDKE